MKKVSSVGKRGGAKGGRQGRPPSRKGRGGGQRQKKSGAQYRKEKREREEAAAIDGDEERSEESIEAYVEIGPPPKDVVGRVEWAQQMMAQALFETATDRSTPAKEVHRVVGDLGAKIGIT